ncbi:MAG: helix-turn-helix domain-containing protein, partial [Micromonosporaceae bacterium]
MTPPDDAARPGSGAKASAIAKAVVVLEALVEQRRLSAIARSTGLPTSTVHRVLQELATLGWVREGEERDYMLGPGLL